MSSVLTKAEAMSCDNIGMHELSEEAILLLQRLDNLRAAGGEVGDLQGSFGRGDEILGKVERYLFGAM